MDFRGGPVVLPRMPTEVVSETDFPGGADTVNKKFTNAGDAGPGTIVVDGGGPRVSPVHVSLIFWGAAWQNDSLRAALTNAVAKIVTGKYLSALGQYGAATSGTVSRVLLDTLLTRAGLPAHRIRGYDRQRSRPTMSPRSSSGSSTTTRCLNRTPTGSTYTS